MRPSLEDTFMDLALVWAKRSTCSEKFAVGCVLVNPFNQVIASGYNGSPRGIEHCDAVGCDDDGKIHRVVHAEANAIVMCALNGTSSRASIMYITHCPCLRCAQLIIQAGILEVIYLKEVGDILAVKHLLYTAEIKLTAWWMKK